MPWFKVDDGLHSHPKWIACPLAARGLWVSAGSWAACQLTDGFVPRNALPMLGGKPKDAAALVAAGMWLEEGNGWRFHDWEQAQPTREQVEAARGIARRRSALNHDPEMRKLIRARDGDHCRYCARVLSWRDRRSENGGTYDHVIPVSAGGGDSPENIVAACRACNLKKGPRTPEQAGMELLPIQPRSSPDLARTTTTRPDPTRRTPPSPPRGEPRGATPDVSDLRLVPDEPLAPMPEPLRRAARGTNGVH